MPKSNLVNAPMFRIGVLLAALVVVTGVIITVTGVDFNGVASGRRDNFFEQFFIAGGPVVWFVLFPLSLVTVYLAAEHALTINRKKLISNTDAQELKQRPGLCDAKRLRRELSDRDDLVSVALKEAVEKGKGDWFRMRSVIQESLQEQAGRLLRRIEWLNLIGGVSPMVGLFGTVFGMIKLFNSIVAAGGQPQPAHLADGISVALVTTFWGLFIAIPAVALHGIFRNRVEMFVSEAVSISESIVPLLKPQPVGTAGGTDDKKIEFGKVPIVPVEESKKKDTSATKG